MTTDGLREPGERVQAADSAGQGEGLRVEGRPTTTVPVIPLWQRLDGGTRG
ncbi:hypothetical protein [Streptomyces cupreus]|uniref:Uncharacterized protein n=1 Tax=Streptomyces cupreus TaxID=2759956 RepID=A0A7X1M869_9ACTN|nr:hypothetical protein [Streptomyces cupreus]MBC2901356.1 hypothetical protein [Streptomyces cupreus]